MLIVEHRVNTRAALEKVPEHHGVEVDIRDCGTRLELVHDPFLRGEALEPFLDAYRHALIILNVKCDGLEEHILPLLAARGIDRYFFLDSAAPTFVRLARGGCRDLGVRYSEFETLEYALSFADQVEWVWVDCFTRLPFDGDAYERLRAAFKICLVSPELQGHPRSWIATFREQLAGRPVDAVCTDFPDDWTR